MTSEVSFKSDISVNERIFGYDLETKVVVKLMKLHFKYPADGSPLIISIETEANGHQKKEIRPGDEFNLSYVARSHWSQKMDENHPFPIELDFAGQTYKLNKTKNNKLLLTK